MAVFPDLLHPCDSSAVRFCSVARSGVTRLSRSSSSSCAVRIPRGSANASRRQPFLGRVVAGVALADREFSLSASTNYIKRPDGERVSVYLYAVDPDFFTTLGIDLVSGRSFAAGRVADRTKSVVVNQRLAEAYGWGENAVGEFLPELRGATG